MQAANAATASLAIMPPALLAYAQVQPGCDVPYLGAPQLVLSCDILVEFCYRSFSHLPCLHICSKGINYGASVKSGRQERIASAGTSAGHCHERRLED